MNVLRRKSVLFSLCAVCVVLLGLLYYLWQTPEPSGVVDLRGKTHVSIVLTEEGFEPQYARVTQGTTVTFTTTRPHAFWPASNPHPQHTIYPAFDPKQPIPADGSWSFVMDRVGLWGYHDHVRSYYTGTLYVE